MAAGRIVIAAARRRLRLAPGRVLCAGAAGVLPGARLQGALRRHAHTPRVFKQKPPAPLRGEADRARVLLVDGTNLVYRCHYAHANNPLVNSKGVDVGIPFQFCKSLAQIMARVQPTHCACVFDAPDACETRRRISPSYKTGRESTPAAVIDQLPALVDLLDAMGLCTVAYPANEADDVIGTMVQRLCAGADRDAAAAATTEGNVHTYIVSTDKDFQQLLGAGCSIMKPLNGGGLSEVTPATFAEQLPGLTPHEFVDYLALVGDRVDAVPGVRGIGAKTAHKLLVQHRTISTVLAAARDKAVTKQALGLSDRLRKNLLEDAELLLQGQTLITLDCDLDLSAVGLGREPDQLADGLLIRPGDEHRILNIISDIEMPSLARMLQSIGILPGLPNSRGASPGPHVAAGNRGKRGGKQGKPGGGRGALLSPISATSQPQPAAPTTPATGDDATVSPFAALGTRAVARGQNS